MKPVKLSKNILFKASLWVGLVASAFLSGLIVINNDLIWCLEIRCFSNLTEIYEIPIKVLTASIALAAFIAIIHRSNQTNYQIDLTINQNTFKNFMDHRSELYNVLDTLESDNDILFKNRNHLYVSLFPNNNLQNVEFVSPEKECGKSKIIRCIDKYNELIPEYNSIIKKLESEGKSPHKDLALWIPRFMMLSYDMCIHPKHTKKVNSIWGEFINPLLIEGIPEDLNKFIYSVVNSLVELSDFCLPGVDIEILFDGRDYSLYVNELAEAFWKELPNDEHNQQLHRSANSAPDEQ